jgi:hypothetical protein
VYREHDGTAERALFVIAREGPRKPHMARPVGERQPGRYYSPPRHGGRPGRVDRRGHNSGRARAAGGIRFPARARCHGPSG